MGARRDRRSTQCEGPTLGLPAAIVQRSAERYSPYETGKRHMSDLASLASGLGIPTVVLSVAAAFRYAGAAADRDGRPEALDTVARILGNSSWSRSVRPSAIIQEVFNRTFGERQFSWKCLRRSVAASVLFVLISSCIFYSAVINTIKVLQLFGGYASLGFDASSLEGLLFGWIPSILFFLLGDYVSLWKTRAIIQVLGRMRTGLLLVVLDIILSLAIVFVVRVLTFETAMSLAAIMDSDYADLNLHLSNHAFHDAHKSVIELIQRSNSAENWSVIIYDYFLSMRGTMLQGRIIVITELLMLSTLFTSVWTMLILLSAFILKCLSPVQRFTTWFFDVDKHPFRALGDVAAGLIVLGSAAWSVARWVV